MTIDDDFDAKYDFYQNVAVTNGFAHSTWSIYEVTDFEQVPFPNAIKLRYEGDAYWGNFPVEVPLSRNSTWLDLWRAADNAIKLSRDNHHIYIEDFDEDGDVLGLVTGS